MKKKREMNEDKKFHAFVVSQITISLYLNLTKTLIFADYEYITFFYTICVVQNVLNLLYIFH